MAATRNNNRFKIRNNDRGITLVEMIVVLVIMAILAASGIFTGVGYIKRSRFQKNEANAEIVYNAVQTALQQKEKAGTIDDWTKNLIGKGTPLASTGSNKPEQSSLEEANSVYVLCAGIASQMTSLCYTIALSSPVAFSIRPYDRVTIDVVFSNVDAMNGSINEDSFSYLLYSMRDIA